MRCPECGVFEGRTTDSRPTEDGRVRRRRECRNGHRFTTFEEVAREPCGDPMERLVADALDRAGINYHRGEATGELDFRLIDYGVHIEVKRFHSPRIERQMARHPNVIAAQGEAAVQLLARFIQSWAL